ncbi:MAG TPA: hypothetical protein VF402_03405 [Asticcacaulis sp.]
MPLRPRVSLSVDKALNILTLRYIGDMDGATLYAQLLDQFLRVGDPWTYDLIVDFSRYEGVLLTSDNEAFGRVWEDLAQGRDAGRLMAIVSRDPLIIARKAVRAYIFPNFIIDSFITCAEAQDWICDHRGLPRAVCA